MSVEKYAKILVSIVSFWFSEVLLHLNTKILSIWVGQHWVRLVSFCYQTVGCSQVDLISWWETSPSKWLEFCLTVYCFAPCDSEKMKKWMIKNWKMLKHLDFDLELIIHVTQRSFLLPLFSLDSKAVSHSLRDKDHLGTTCSDISQANS